MSQSFYSLYYRPQRSCEGYVFTGVCLSTRGVPGPGGCLVWGGGSAPGEVPPRGGGGACSGGMPGPGGAWSGGCLVWGGAGSGGWYPSMHWGRHTPSPGRDGYCCGWYASYWNAFLFPNGIIENPHSVVDLRKTPLRPPGPKFSQFHAVFRKIWQNHMLAPPPLQGILDPPLLLPIYTERKGKAKKYIWYLLVLLWSLVLVVCSFSLSIPHSLALTRYE